MANAIADIAAKATLDVGPFARSTKQMERDTQNSVGRIQQSFRQVRGSLREVTSAQQSFAERAQNVRNALMGGAGLGTAIASFNFIRNQIRTATAELEQQVDAGQASDGIRSQVNEIRNLRAQLRPARDEWNSFWADGERGILRIANAWQHLDQMSFADRLAMHGTFGIAGAATNFGQIAPVTPQDQIASGKPPAPSWLGDWQQQINNAFQGLVDATVQVVDAQNEAARLIDQTRTPYERFLDATDRIDFLRERNMLTQDQAERARAGALERIMQGIQDTPGIGSLEAGSAEVADIIANASNPQMDVMQSILAANQAQAENTRRLADLAAQLVQQGQRQEDVAADLSNQMPLL